MFSIASETDVEKLRTVATLLESENARLVHKLSDMMRELMTLQGKDQAQMSLRIAELEQQLASRNKKLFGQTTERRPNPKPTDPVQGKTSAEGKPQTGHGPKAQPELPMVEAKHDLDVGDRACTSCGGALAEWEGQFEESEEIDVIERQFVLRKHKRKKYRCRCGGCIETAIGPKKLFAGARYSIDFAVAVAISKYLDHLPLERQVRTMAREGLTVDSQTLWDQTERLARLLSPALERLHRYTLANGVVGADETTWWRMRGRGEGPGPSERWYMWAVVAPNAVYYRLDESRSAEAAGKLLKEYAGIVMCDGYKGYTALAAKYPGLIIANCWSHVRRAFIECEGHEPEKVAVVLKWIQELFAIEREAATGSLEQRLKIRQEKSKPVLDAINRWQLSVLGLPESTFGQAVKYMFSRWSALVRFADDARIPLHNNASERAVRGPVGGRKNFRGCRSKRGMEVAALFYSLLESAKLIDVNPHRYLRAAVDAALDGREIPLPHEYAAALA
jgi:transposase